MPGATYVKVGGLDKLALAFNQLSTTWKQVAAITLNNTQRDVMNQVTIKQMRTFHIRAPRFDLPPDPVPQAWTATPERLQVTMALAKDTGNKSNLGTQITQVFSKFGTAQRKVADDPRQPIAIPTKALQPTPMSLVSRSMYPNKILPGGADYSPARLTKKGRISQASGKYFVLGKAGQKDYGIYERTGDRSHPIRMLWAFRASIPVRHKLDFEKDAEAVIAARWRINWDNAWAMVARK